MARRQAAWRDYASLRQSRRRSLASGAMKYLETGDQKYYDRYQEFMRVSKSIVRESNKRLLALEKQNLDYGHPYNNLSFYLDVELRGARRIPSPSSLSSGKYNYNDDNTWFISMEQGMKFLRSPLSTVSGVKASNKARVEALQEREVLPAEIVSNGTVRKADWHDFEDFLKFLGNEEIASAIDAWGESDVIVDALWDYWNNDENNRTSNMRLMKMAFAQYLAGKKTFDEALLERGVKIEDYMRKKYRKNS